MAIVSAADAKARVESLTDYTDAIVDAAIAEFTEIATKYRGCNWEPTEHVEQVQGTLGWTVALGWPLVSDVASVEADGVALDLTQLKINKRAGVLTGITWPSQVLDPVVTYTAGYDEFPPGLVRVAIEYARRTLKAESSGTSRDFRSQAFDGGTTNYVMPGPRNPTGFLEVDRILNTFEDFRKIAFA